MDISKVALLKACCGISFYECCQVILIGYRMTGVIVVFFFFFWVLSSKKNLRRIFAIWQNTNIWNFFFKIAMFCPIVQPSRQAVEGI
jgi:hypothetical protein